MTKAREQYSYSREGNYSFFGEFDGGVQSGIGIGADWNKLARYVNPVETALYSGSSVYVSDLFTTIEGVPIYLTDGSVGTPALAWQNDRDSVLYRLGSQNFGWSVGATLKYDWNATRIKFAAGFSVDVTDLTATGVVFAGTGGRLTTDAGLTYASATDKLTILGATGGAQQRWAYDGSNYAEVLVDSIGDFYIQPSGNAVYIQQGSSNTSELWIDAPTAKYSILYLSDTGTVKWSLYRNATNNDLRIDDDSDTRLRIYQATGNIGFGSSSEPLFWDNTNLQQKISRSDTAVTPFLDLIQSSTGDTALRFTLAGGDSFIHGIDNSDGNLLKFSYGSAANAALGTNDYLSIAPNGDVTAYLGFGVGAAVSGATMVGVTDSETIASGASAVWDGVSFVTAAATLSGSTNITTASGFNFFNINAPTIDAASALTITNAATQTIKGAPVGGGAGPVTITNAYSLWIQAGKSRFDGVILGSQGTVSAPGFAFKDGSNDGMYQRAATVLDFACNGSAHLELGNFRVALIASDLYWQDSLGGSLKAGILKISDDVLGIKNGTNAEALRVYGDGSLYVSIIHSGSGGVGQITTSTSLPLRLGMNNTAYWMVDTNAAWVPTVDANVTLGDGTHRIIAGYFSSFINNDGYEQFTEIADPAAGAANTGRLYCKDNGAGKTQLVVRFNSGAVQVIATEP